MKQKLKFSKFRKPKDVVVIYYDRTSGAQNKKFWTAKFNGEITAYNTKLNLIASAEKDGNEWMVIRFHKKEKGMITIVKFSGKKIQFNK